MVTADGIIRVSIGVVWATASNEGHSDRRGIGAELIEKVGSTVVFRRQPEARQQRRHRTRCTGRGQVRTTCGRHKTSAHHEDLNARIPRRARLATEHLFKERLKFRIDLAHVLTPEELRNEGAANAEQRDSEAEFRKQQLVLNVLVEVRPARHVGRPIADDEVSTISFKVSQNGLGRRHMRDVPLNLYNAVNGLHLEFVHSYNAHALFATALAGARILERNLRGRIAKQWLCAEKTHC
mmetsp:Transcript_95187/g.269003  ORF Transcript_95187/g.269003 Transcript_95187/m.269003 type:complete len:238 (+) Transcript_95187:203-916(+)